MLPNKKVKFNESIWMDFLLLTHQECKKMVSQPGPSIFDQILEYVFCSNVCLYVRPSEFCSLFKIRHVMGALIMT